MPQETQQEWAVRSILEAEGPLRSDEVAHYAAPMPKATVLLGLKALRDRGDVDRDEAGRWYLKPVMRFVDPIPEENWGAVGWMPNFVDLQDHYEIVMVPPRDFLAYVDPGFGTAALTYYQRSMDWLEEQARAGRSFAPLQAWGYAEDHELLKAGTPPNPPGWDPEHLDKVRRHEGRHRALLAERLGVPLVPVALWRVRRGNSARAGFDTRKLKTKLLR